MGKGVAFMVPIMFIVSFYGDVMYAVCHVQASTLGVVVVLCSRPAGYVGLVRYHPPWNDVSKFEYSSTKLIPQNEGVVKIDLFQNV